MFIKRKWNRKGVKLNNTQQNTLKYNKSVDINKIRLYYKHIIWKEEA